MSCETCWVAVVAHACSQHSELPCELFNMGKHPDLAVRSASITDAHALSGHLQHVDWANLPNEDAFFNSTVAETLYQVHIRKVRGSLTPTACSAWPVMLHVTYRHDRASGFAPRRRVLRPRGDAEHPDRCCWIEYNHSHMFLQVLTRVNVFNGRTYSEDPAILAWNVINEPRNPASQIIPGV